MGKRPALSVTVPALSASAITTVMYLGEMILLHGHLYRFGTSLLCQGIPGIVLAPIDLLVIVASGGITALLSILAGRGVKERSSEES